MSNEVIHEIRVIETEDGYTIEMKGDKEALREMIFSAQGLNLYGKRMGGGARGRRHNGEKHGHRGHREHGHHQKTKRHFGRGEWKERMRERRQERQHAETPEYDLGPWLETDGSDEVTAL